MPDGTKTVDINSIKEKLASLAENVTLVHTIVCIKEHKNNQLLVYFIDDKDRCMCSLFTVLENFVKKYKAKDQKDIMVI